MKKLLLSLLAVTTFYTSDALAGAVNPISGVGTRAKAMGGVGAAVAEGASVFYYNPALMTKTRDMRVDAGLDYINANIQYQDPTGAVHNSNPGEYFIPLLGMTGSTEYGFKLGIGLVTPNMFGSDFKKENMYSKLGLTNLTPAIAFKLTDSLSVGASGSVGYGMVDLTTPILGGAVDMEARGFGHSYQLGLLYEPTDWLSLGSSYQSKTKVNLTGTTTARTVLGVMEDDFSADFYFPGRIHFGVGVKPTEKFLVAADATYMDYSSTDKVYINQYNWPDNVLVLDWKSHWVYGLGAEYAVSRHLKLRSGISYQEQAIPDSTVSPITPDTDGGVSGSLGLGWKKDNLEIDIAYVNAQGREREIPLPNPGAGKYSADIDIFSAGVSYRW